MENNQKPEHHSEHHTGQKNWYDKSYKLLLIIPVFIFLVSIIFMISFYHQHGDFLKKDVSLTGGTTVTIFDTKADAKSIAASLQKQFPDLEYRVISDFGSGQQKGFSVETSSQSQNVTQALEKILGYSLTPDNSSVEFSGATLSGGFYVQLINAIIAAFLLMAWVVFLIFSHSWKIRAFSTMITFFGASVVLSSIGWLKALAVLLILAGGCIAVFNKKSSNIERILAVVGIIVLPLVLYLYPYELLVLFAGAGLIAIYIYNSIPSFAIILSAFADIFMTLVVVDIFGISISSAGIIAFLMLIGYSVDTDILLTTRLLRSSEGSVNQRIFGAFKTGMTMTLTAIASVGVSLLLVYSFSGTLRQIFEIILIGLFFDIFNTWITNASMLKWFMEAKKLS